jgi:hypothetical protein
MLVTDITAFAVSAICIVIVAISGLTAFTSSTAIATIIGPAVIATFNIFYNETASHLQRQCLYISPAITEK